MTDQQLETLYLELLSKYFPDKKLIVQATFYNTKSIRHTIELNSKTIHFRIAESFRIVPEHILTILGLILLAKIFRYKIDRALQRQYREYVNANILPHHQPPVRRPSSRYTAQGRFFDLHEIFDDINRGYFKDKISVPKLGWSLNRSYARLGFYSAEKNLLVISKIFDSKKVPRKIVEYLMYHEMLHIHLPTQIVNGRRRIHPPEFRKLEQQFPEYENIQTWIHKKRHRL